MDDKIIKQTIDVILELPDNMETQPIEPLVFRVCGPPIYGDAYFVPTFPVGPPVKGKTTIHYDKDGNKRGETFTPDGCEDFPMDFFEKPTGEYKPMIMPDDLAKAWKAWYDYYKNNGY